jgi:hypothetical protein
LFDGFPHGSGASRRLSSGHARPCFSKPLGAFNGKTTSVVDIGRVCLRFLTGLHGINPWLRHLIVPISVDNQVHVAVEKVAAHIYQTNRPVFDTYFSNVVIDVDLAHIIMGLMRKILFGSKSHRFDAVKSVPCNNHLGVRVVGAEVMQLMFHMRIVATTKAEAGKKLVGEIARKRVKAVLTAPASAAQLLRAKLITRQEVDKIMSEKKADLLPRLKELYPDRKGLKGLLIATQRELVFDGLLAQGPLNEEGMEPVAAARADAEADMKEQDEPPLPPPSPVERVRSSGMSSYDDELEAMRDVVTEGVALLVRADVVAQLSEAKLDTGGRERVLRSRLVTHLLNTSLAEKDVQRYVDDIQNDWENLPVEEPDSTEKTAAAMPPRLGEQPDRRDDESFSEKTKQLRKLLVDLSVLEEGKPGWLDPTDPLTRMGPLGEAPALHAPVNPALETLHGFVGDLIGIALSTVHSRQSDRTVADIALCLLRAFELLLEENRNVAKLLYDPDVWKECPDVAMLVQMFSDLREVVEANYAMCHGSVEQQLDTVSRLVLVAGRTHCTGHQSCLLSLFHQLLYLREKCPKVLLCMVENRNQCVWGGWGGAACLTWQSRITSVNLEALHGSLEKLSVRDLRDAAWVTQQAPRLLFAQTVKFTLDPNAIPIVPETWDPTALFFGHRIINMTAARKEKELEVEQLQRLIMQRFWEALFAKTEVTGTDVMSSVFERYHTKRLAGNEGKDAREADLKLAEDRFIASLRLKSEDVPAMNQMVSAVTAALNSGTVVSDAALGCTTSPPFVDWIKQSQEGIGGAYRVGAWCGGGGK